MGSYLVTGAAGFIAARVCELLLAEGHSVVGVDNLNDAYDVRLKLYRLARLQKHKNFTFQRLDISDRSAIKALSGDSEVGRPLKTSFDAMFNLAARAGVRASVENPWTFVDTNITGTLNMLELCRQQGIPKFVQASTSGLYGSHPPLPTPETASTDFPLQPYAATKKGAEGMCHAYHFLHGIDVTIFRYFTVYGPAGRPDMFMFRFVHWIKEGKSLCLNGDGAQSRGVTYLDDIARGTILGLKRLGYEIINLGGHQVISLNETIARLEVLLGQKAHVEYLPSHKADILASQADVNLARRVLGWEPQVGLDEGMGRLVDWYMAERGWAKDITLD
jgi:UDP-glucuronate 4-epimerase